MPGKIGAVEGHTVKSRFADSTAPPLLSDSSKTSFRGFSLDTCILSYRRRAHAAADSSHAASERWETHTGQRDPQVRTVPITLHVSLSDKRVPHAHGQKLCWALNTPPEKCLYALPAGCYGKLYPSTKSSRMLKQRECISTETTQKHGCPCHS